VRISVVSTILDRDYRLTLPGFMIRSNYMLIYMYSFHTDFTSVSRETYAIFILYHKRYQILHKYL